MHVVAFQEEVQTVVEDRFEQDGRDLVRRSWLWARETLAVAWEFDDVALAVSSGRLVDLADDQVVALLYCRAGHMNAMAEKAEVVLVEVASYACHRYAESSHVEVVQPEEAEVVVLVHVEALLEMVPVHPIAVEVHSELQPRPGSDEVARPAVEVHHFGLHQLHYFHFEAAVNVP